ncbi:MAG TPA: hypothetical protein VK641_03140 [Terriglobales bacterium]|jgi:hypothetical protein|nr:hypothetical protein [Terriglobales bacterium]
MKFWLVALLGFTVSGCAMHQTAAYRGSSTNRCSIVAEQRAQDGALNGYNEDLQRRVFIDTYADCEKQEAAYKIRLDLRSLTQEPQDPPM